MNMEFSMVLVLTLVFGYSEGQTTTQVRLVDGNSTAGRVQVLHNGTWRQVCDDCFDIPEAWAICRMLNFTNGGEPIKLQWNRSSSFWIDDLRCECGQTIDTGCIFRQWGQHDCSAFEAVGVSCYDGVPTPPATCAPTVLTGESKCIRLTTSSNPTFSTSVPAVTDGNGEIRLIGPAIYPGIGCVEIFYNGAWGSICDDFLGTNNARVICRQFGYDPNDARAGIQAEYSNFRQNTSSTIVLDDVRCNGSEARIDQCPRSPYGVHNCTTNEKLCVSCQSTIETTPELPIPNVECNNGIISASFSRALYSGLTEGNIGVSSGPCPYATTSTDVNFVTINIPFDECNTGIRTNETHIVYYNTIRYNFTDTSNVITRVYVTEVSVSCVFPRDLDANNVVNPLPHTVPMEAPGQYDMNLLFFLDNSFEVPVLSTPVNLTIAEWLNAALTLEAVRTDSKLVVPNCVATPSTNQYDAVNYPLFIDKCERDSTLTFLPLNSTSFGFRYQTFMFPYHEMVYIHCDAIVCLQSEKTEQCDRSCSRQNTTGAGRRKRDTDVDSNREYYHLRSPPLRLRRQEGFNYVITDLNVTVTGILRKGEPILNSTINDPESAEANHSKSQNQAVENANNQSATTGDVELQQRKEKITATDDTSAKNNNAQDLPVEVHFNYDEPFVAGMGSMLQNSSKMITPSCLLILLCSVIFKPIVI